MQRPLSEVVHLYFMWVIIAGLVMHSACSGDVTLQNSKRITDIERTLNDRQGSTYDVPRGEG